MDSKSNPALTSVSGSGDFTGPFSILETFSTIPGTVSFFILLTFEIIGLVSDSPSDARPSSTVFDFVLDSVTSKLSSELETSCFSTGSKSLSGSVSEMVRLLVDLTGISSSESSMLIIGTSVL